MRYEVRCGDVKVYESDIECDVRVLEDGVEVYALKGTPTFQGNAQDGFTRILMGGKTEAIYKDDKGKDHKLPEKAWAP